MQHERDLARERLVRVAVAENPITAELIRETLTAAGIRCMTKNRDGLSVMFGGSTPVPWALEIWVLEGDADAASALLGGGPAAPPLPPPSLQRSTPKRRWWRRRAQP